LTNSQNASVKENAALAPPSADEFARILGQVTWLTTLSSDHKIRSIEWLEHMVVAPIMLKQVRIFTKGEQPVAAVLWAYASDEVKAKIAAGNQVMKLSDWRSGPNVEVVDCIAPTGSRAAVIDLFLKQVATSSARNSETPEVSQ